MYMHTSHKLSRNLKKTIVVYIMQDLDYHNVVLHFLQIKLNVIDFAMPEIKNLYQWLEEDFHPLKLCKDVESVTNILNENEELNTYVKPLQDLAVVKLLNQVNKILNGIHQ